MNDQAGGASASNAGLGPEPERADLTPATMKRLGYYNWKGQPDRLVYLGRNRSGNGWWHQFRKIGDPRDVWCEVTDADLHMLEETVDTDEPDPDPHEDPAAIFGDPRA